MKNLVELSQNREHYSVKNAKIQKLFEKLLTTPNRSPYSVPAFAKSKAFGRDNSKNRHTANNSTPLTRAFFVRSLRIPKERPPVACSSMVACSGKGFALCCVPYVAVCHPVARYRPLTVTSEAIAPFNFHTELSAMKQFAYSFLCVNRTADTYQEEVIRIVADSEQNARFQLCADYRLALSHPIARIALNPTPCTQANGGIYA